MFGINYLLIGFIILFLLKSKTFGSNKEVSENFVDTNEVTEKEFAVLSETYKQVQEYANNFVNKYGGIEVAQLIAMVVQESGFLIVKGKKNNEIFGDLNLKDIAYGFCQVRKPAYLQVIKEHPNMNTFAFEELSSSESVNCLFGFLYLKGRFDLAKLQGSSNPVKLAYKKYNGGDSKTDFSQGNAETNSLSYLRWYNYYKSQGVL